VSFAAVFIRRPVLSTVLSLLILLLGAQSATNLEVRQYPRVDETVISIATAYPGASAELVQSFISTPVAKAAASAEGVDFVTATSALGMSEVEVHMRLGTDSDQALTEVIAKTQQARRDLPEDAYDPIVTKGTDRPVGLMFITFSSDRMSDLQISEYVKRVVQPRMATVPGVADARLIGGLNFAMRVWLDPVQLAAHDVTAAEVAAAIPARRRTSSPPLPSRPSRRSRRRTRSARCRFAARATTSCACAMWRAWSWAQPMTMCASSQRGGSL
jgi:multidrug efflux pump